MQVTASSEPLHCMTCNTNAGSWTYRHDEIRDCFVRLIRKIYPHNMITTEALVGKTAPNAHGAAREVFSDETLVLGAETLIIDFAVVSPGGAKYLQYPTRSATTLDAAAFHEEASKRRHSGLPTHTHLTLLSHSSSRRLDDLAPLPWAFFIASAPPKPISAPASSMLSLLFLLALPVEFSELPVIENAGSP
jgi:hypothetical protein